MTRRRPGKIVPFRSGESEFLFEENAVRILGESGSEAAVPFEDFKALLDYLHDTNAPVRKESGLSNEEGDS